MLSLRERGVPLIGVISDTHGLLRPEAAKLLRGVSRIIHAGDIGPASVIDRLQAIAPVSVVRGNNDNDAWARQLPLSTVLVESGQRIVVLHELAQLQALMDSMQSPPDVVITGHSHQPSISRRDGMLFLNPGSAGPRRFKLPVTLATLLVEREGVQAMIHELHIPPARRLV